MTASLEGARLAVLRAIVVFGLIASIPGTVLPEERLPVRSGLQSGETVPQFYVRAITGPLRNKSVCYVCRNGDRPVVMVLAREINGDLRQLLKGLDQVVDQHRADGLRCFGVFVADHARQLAPQIQTLAFDDKLSLPLTLSVSSAEGPAGQELHTDASVTVVLYSELTVRANFAYRQGELTRAERLRILRQAEMLARGELRPHAAE